MSWKALKEHQPDLAAFGESRFASQVAYLATIRKDGSPRVHPVTPILGNDRLFVFMEPDSPKGWDLKRDNRYAMHSSVEDSDGGGGEFHIRGSVTLVEDEDSRSVAGENASYDPAPRYILFELGINAAFSTVYSSEGDAVRRRWKVEA